MRHRILLGLVLSLASLTLPGVAAAQWVTATTDTLAGTAASERSTRFSVAVDAVDAPHAIWSLGSLVFYSRKDGGGWIPPIQLGSADATYTPHAVAVVPGTSRACVLYSRTPFGSPAGELLLAEWNGSAFDVRTLTMDGVAKTGPVLAMDASGAYHVVCVVQASGEFRLRYLTNVTGSPIDSLLAVGPLGSFGSGASPAIAIGPGGIAHIVYRGVSGGYRIHHAENAAPGGTTWSWETLLSPNADDVASDIRIDAFGTVHVVTSGSDCDLCTRRAHVLQRPAGGAWSVATPIVHTSGLSSPSLAVDAAGGAHVALSEISGSLFSGRIFYASSRDAWTPSLVIGNDHGTPSLAMDALGRGHLVCTTGPNSGLRNVLYLRSQSTTVGVSEPALPPAIAWRAFPNPFRGQTTLRAAGGSSAGATGAAVLIVDIAGRMVRRLGPTIASEGAVEYVWDGRTDAGRMAPSGVYRIAAAGSGSASAGTRGMMVVKLP